MPITFGELVQEVINEVRTREQFQQLAQQQDVKIKALEAEIAELKKHGVLDKPIVREPDIKPILKEVK